MQLCIKLKYISILFLISTELFKYHPITNFKSIVNIIIMGNNQTANCCVNQINSPSYIYCSNQSQNTDIIAHKVTSYRIIGGDIDSDDQKIIQDSKFFVKQYSIIKKHQLIVIINQINPSILQILNKKSISLENQWYLFRSGIYYAGKIHNGVPYGIGRYIFKSGAFYCGQIYQQSLHGMAYYITQDGNYYFGEFKNSKFHGNGSLQGSNNIKFIGQWYQGYLIKGQIIYKNGSFIGEFNHEGQLTGKLCKVINQKFIYVGDYKEGKKNGFGKILKKNYILYGNWVNDCLQGQCTISFDKLIWKGTINKGIPINGKWQKINQ